MRDWILYLIIAVMFGSNTLGFKIPLFSQNKEDAITKDTLRDDQEKQTMALTAAFKEMMYQLKEDIRRDRKDDFETFKRDFLKSYYRNYNNK